MGWDAGGEWYRFRTFRQCAVRHTASLVMITVPRPRAPDPVYFELIQLADKFAITQVLPLPQARW